MSSSSYGECKKFQPNIFNKIKCTYCFKPKEEHSNEALESNRVTRKAVKCGYLFVAPFSDFSNPINKTKRWQRRWFVLYDDGELKYALDDYPETVPQACIDMNKVLTVQAAEDATSHPFSLCIDTGESLHYVKATCREETQWWSDVLNSYKGRKTKANGVNSTPYSTRITSSSSSSVWESGDIFPTRERDVHVTSPTGNNENNMSAANVQTKIYVGSPPTRDKVSTDDKIRLRNSSSTSSRSSPNQQSDYTRSNPNQTTNNSDYTRHSTNNNSHSEYSRTNTSDFSTEYRTSSDYTRSSAGSDYLRSPTSVNTSSTSDFARKSSVSSAEFLRSPISGAKNATAGGVEITVHSPSERRSSEHSRNSPNTMNNAGNTPGSSEYSRSSTNSLTDGVASSSPTLGSLSSINGSARLSASESSSTRSNHTSATSRLNSSSEGHTSSRTNHSSATSRLANDDGNSTRLNHTSAASRLNSSDAGTGSSTRLSHGSAASRLENDSTRLTHGPSSNTRLSHSSSGISSGSSTRLSNSSMEDVSSAKMNGLGSWDTTDKGPSSPRRSSSASHASTLIMDEKPVRGDPDGCGLDPLSPLRRHSPTPELRLDLTGNSDHYLNIKKGWLMKQANSGQSWNKHWFVLRGCSLLYYRDPKAEETGVLDGVVALNNVTSLSEVPVARNFGFQITTWDSKRTVLSAVTAGIRTNWMSAIKRTGTLSLLEDKNDGSSPTVQTDSPSTPRSLLFSSDDEYRTASEGGRRGSTASDWGEILPPSPPLIRTPISRVKERARSISRSGGGTSGGAGSTSSRLSMSHRSRSSPPSSRRSTLDSVRTEDLSLPCCGELPEPEMESTGLILNDKLSTSSSSSPLLTDPRQHRLEVEELKVQLNNSLLELTNAETEILGLKHFKLQAEELSKKLHRCEELLKQKSEELNELGTYKTRYFQEKSTWEQELNAAEIELVTSGQRVEELCRQLGSSREQVVRLREELESVTRTKQDLEERMNRGMEENENLYRRIRDLEGNHHSLRESKGRSLDSLSDLTNVFLDLDLDQLDKDRVVEEFDNLRTRFEKAVSEIRIMKRELRLAQSEQDCVELSLISMSQELKAQQELSESQTSLMACKIQDLTLKLSQAEKQVRAFRHKMSKLETRDKRHRSLSLKADGKESLSLCKELEEKLFQLEGKLNQLERGGVHTADKLSSTESPSRLSSSTKMTRLRRKSLDSVNEQTNIDPMKILFRVTDLEKRINKASTGFSPMSQIDEKPRQLPSISRDEVDSRPSPTSAIVILNENAADQSVRNSEQSRTVPKLTRQNSGDSPTSSPVKPKFNISSSSASDEVTSRDAMLRPNEYEVSRPGNELLRSINEDESAHASLLNSIEYEVSQIESLVREHSVSLNELDLSRADSITSLNDSAWIADLSAKCGEIKQQIVSLQECLKNESGTSQVGSAVVVCTKCCSSETTEFVDDKSHIDRSGQQTPCKQCFEYEHQLRKQQEQCASMKKLMQQDREEALRSRSQTTPCSRCKELEERVREYKERVERLQDKPSSAPLSSSSSSCPQCLSLQSELNAKQTTYLTSMKQLETLCEANFDKCYELEAMIQDKDKTLVEEIEKKRREYEKKMNELSNEYKEEKEHLVRLVL
uniref:Protein outspread n=1 Tax=Cacopsylla melanoneura TaxID=428564 RepID=A0A8D8YE07_9HEMI